MKQITIPVTKRDRDKRRYQIFRNGLFCASLITCSLSVGIAALESHGRLAFSIIVFITVTATLLELRLTRAELATERNLLERRVIERTRLLEEMQLRRTIELQRFAEFGRISAHLLHEVANPLTVASLYLQQADVRSSAAIKQAKRSLLQLERYVDTARKQLKTQSEHGNFVLQHELKQLFAILRPIARQSGVQLIMSESPPITLHGDAVRFSQVMSNLITNAIDAYKDIATGQKLVSVDVTQFGRFVHITVHDAGKGIKPLQITQIFEPFYTTKQGTTRGLGIGLAMVKQTVREQFHGTICANSSPENGTTFTMLLCIKPPLLAAASSQPITTFSATSSLLASGR